MLRFSQNLSLQQRMAPQLIQSLQLLQMSTLELELEIQQQMEINPLLEESLDIEEDGDEEDGVEEGLEEEAELPGDSEEINFDALLEDSFDRNSYNNETSEYDPDWEQDREPRENRITTPTPLLDQLLEQLTVSELEGRDVETAEFIIGNIDDRGYLACTTAEIAEAIQVPEPDVERVLGVVQGFEPPGIGARDLRECLLIQLQLRGDEEGAEVAQRMVREHMDDLSKRRFSRISKALDISNGDLRAAMELVEKLHPAPGILAGTSSYSGLVFDTENPYVTPDLIVEKSDGDWIVSLTDGNLPSLRINSSYAELMGDGGSRGKEELHTYVSKKLNDARWLINAINQRRVTMLKVAEYMVRAQLPFFESGPAHLKPMVLQDVADAVEMHVSTISRVSNGKYMQTPHGVFELKFFFDGRVHREDGEDVSARSVKQKIADLIEEEDKAQPMSDQEIADELASEGLQIARRTVAKYRDQLGINSQRYRKKAF